jgi:cobalt-zinc-cadmium resistance protein CzcA
MILRSLRCGQDCLAVRPLATVVIGGLITSTALTWLVLPAITAWAARFRRDRSGA